MAKAEWGTKRICQHCGKPFYDMKKKQPLCPSCKTPFDIEGTIKGRSSKYSEKRYVIKKEDDVVDDIVDRSDIDDALIEDVEELADESMDEVLTKNSDNDDN